MADAENRLQVQADVVIDARLAADLLGATRMDRPEDVQPNPVTGKVYVILTNNKERVAGEEDAANPRADNVFGHIIEMTPPDGDHAADRFAWEMLVRCGDPSVADVGALWNPETSANGWFACPDNAAVDAQGRLWISTDQGEHWGRPARADGLYALETEGARRRTAKLFFRCPVGAEMCGPCFTPDQETLVRGGAASRRRRHRPLQGLRACLDLRRSRHPLAGFRSRHAAAALGARHHQARRRQNRLTASPSSPSTLEKAAHACELTAFPVH